MMTGKIDGKITRGISNPHITCRYVKQNAFGWHGKLRFLIIESPNHFRIRHEDVLQNHVMASRSAHAHRIPGFLDLDPGSTSNEECTDLLAKLDTGQTTNCFKIGLNVLKVLRPVMRQPPDTRRAVVSGLPPRLGLPVAGSLASSLMSTPSATTSLHSLLNKGSGQAPIGAAGVFARYANRPPAP